ncbi:MAG: helix-turn-helix transcriptional regulator [Candidatus Izemoplasma sp.]
MVISQTDDVDLNIAFRESILQIMKEKNLKNKDLVRLLGVSASYISKLLKKDSNFTLETMQKIASVLNKKVEVTLT